MLNPLRLFLFSAFVSFVSAGAPAQTVTAGDIAIEAPWARASIGTGRPGAAFVTIRNLGRSPDVLTGIETPVSGRAEIHRSKISSGVASMAPAGPVEIPARGEVRLAPGGLHAMLMMLSEPLIKGSSFTLTLVFSKAGRVGVTVPVLGAGARGPQK